MKKNLYVIITFCLLVLIFFVITQKTNQNIKIGIVTPLSGGSSYYGESTLVGAKMAESDLKKEGIDISFIFEDGKLDPVSALSAAQKLVGIDKVSAIYSEFNPASVSISSFLKGKDVFHLYNSAAVSPLENGGNNFKTYLDYQTSCREVAQYIKDNKGVKKVGVLKINLEFGELCTKGVKEIFGDENTYILTYDVGNRDFRSDLIKISNAQVDAVFNVSFKEETVNSIKQMKEFGLNKTFVGLVETITPDVYDQFGDYLKGGILFGLPVVGDSLKLKIKAYNDGLDVADYNAAGSAYVNLMMLGRSVNVCRSNIRCVVKELTNAPANSDIGFEGFENRIAKFKTLIVEVADSGIKTIK